MGQAPLVKGLPLRACVANAQAALGGEAVGTQPAQKDAVEALPHVLIDDGFRLCEAAPSRGHERGDRVMAEGRPHALDPGDGSLVAIPTGTGTVGIVELPWSVE